MLRSLWFVAIACLANSIAAGATQASLLQYRLQELGPVQGSLSSMNKHGDIVGEGYMNNQRIAYRWSHRRVLDLDTDPTSILVSATEINNRREVVGVTVLQTERATRGYIWKAGKVTILDDLPGGMNVSAAEGMNNRGQVVGYADTDEGDDCVLWESGTIMSIGDLPGGRQSCLALDINDRGEIVGIGRADNDAARPFVWREGEMKELPLPDEASVGGAIAVSETGVIFGYYANDNNEGSGLIWIRDIYRRVRIPVGYIAAYASSINRAGFMVGTAYRDNRGDSDAFLWHRGRSINLNSLISADDPLQACVQLWGAVAINNRGEIAASGMNRCENRGANIYRLIPIKRRKPHH